MIQYIEARHILQYFRKMYLFYKKKINFSEIKVYQEKH